MSRTTRALVLALAVVVLVVGFVIAQNAGDDDDSSGSSATVAQTRPAGDAGSEAEAPAADTEGTGEESGALAADESHAAQASAPKPPLIEVEGQQPVGGVQDLTFSKGDEVDFRVRSDVDEEIHVHGYDIEKALPAGKTVRVRFPADIEGRFEIELHGAAVQIAQLEVEP